MSHQQSDPIGNRPANNDQKNGLFRLFVCCLLITIVWGYVFPQLSRWHYFQQLAAARERQGIDSAALFYSDLERMRPCYQSQPQP